MATVSLLSVSGQNSGYTYPRYRDDYLYPPYLARGCYDTAQCARCFCMNTYLGATVSAQPFLIDSTMALKGIAAYLDIERPDLMDLDPPCYLQIRDASLENVLAQVRSDPLQLQTYSLGVAAGYIYIVEFLFDSTVFVSEPLFYASITWTEALFPRIYVSLEETESEKDVLLYPNPTQGVLTVEGLRFDHVKVYDVLGKEQIEPSVQNFTIDLSSLSKGAYMLEFYKQDKIVAKRKVFKE